MTPDLIKAEYLCDYKVQLSFDNGKTGVVDFNKYISKGGIFSELKEIEFFKKFIIDPEVFVLKWPNNVDIAPEEIYSEATGEPLPRWMTDSDKYENVV
jgi:hypothetical protein